MNAVKTESSQKAGMATTATLRFGGRMGTRTRKVWIDSASVLKPVAKSDTCAGEGEGEGSRGQHLDTSRERLRYEQARTWMRPAWSWQTPDSYTRFSATQWKPITYAPPRMASATRVETRYRPSAERRKRCRLETALSGLPQARHDENCSERARTRQQAGLTGERHQGWESWPRTDCERAEQGQHGQDRQQAGDADGLGWRAHRKPGQPAARERCRRGTSGNAP